MPVWKLTPTSLSRRGDPQSCGSKIMMKQSRVNPHYGEKGVEKVVTTSHITPTNSIFNTITGSPSVIGTCLVLALTVLS